MVVALLSFVINGAGAMACGTKQSNAPQNVNQSQGKKSPATPTPVREGKQPVSNDIKVLAEGGHSRVSDSFVLVARDAETYAALRAVADKLPAMDGDFWGANAVVAAFLGQRNTGGFSVEIARAGQGSVRIAENAPSPDMMVTMVLTKPYKIVSVPVNNEDALQLDLGATWKAMLRPYRVTSGEFTMSGGIMGRSNDFRLEGDIRVMRHQKLATFVFSLTAPTPKGASETQNRALMDVASGIVQTDGRIMIPRLDAGSLVDPPRSALRATGTFADNESKLSLTMQSLPSNVADGFEGQGKLEAAATAPAPQKKKPIFEGDEP